MIENKQNKSKSKITSKKRKNIINGVLHIFASFNNTIVSISDTEGNTISWSSSGKNGFKGSRKATPYAAQIATQNVINFAKECGLQNLVVEVRGPGVGREASLRSVQAAGINVTAIKDITYHPHNGCRPAKRRRV